MDGRTGQTENVMSLLSLSGGKCMMITPSPSTSYIFHVTQLYLGFLTPPGEYLWG